MRNLPGRKTLVERFGYCCGHGENPKGVQGARIKSTERTIGSQYCDCPTALGEAAPLVLTGAARWAIALPTVVSAVQTLRP